MKNLMIVSLAVALVCTVRATDSPSDGKSDLSGELGARAMKILVASHELCSRMDEYYSLCWMAVKAVLMDGHIPYVRGLMASVSEFEKQLVDECSDADSKIKDECIHKNIESAKKLLEEIEGKWFEETMKSGAKVFHEILDKNQHIKDILLAQRAEKQGDPDKRNTLKRMLNEIIDRLDKRAQQ